MSSPVGVAAALARRPQAEPALHAAGRWLTTGELLGGSDTAGLVEGGHPATAVPALVAVLRTGRTPVVAAPGTHPAALAALLAAVPGPARRAHLVLPTSGTTGAPRAVLRTVASWDAALDAFTAVTRPGPDEVAWVPGVAASTLTLWALWHALSTGVPAVATGPWRGIPRGPGAGVLERVTVLHAVPAVLGDVLVARERGELPALRTAVVAGAALPAGLRRRAREAGVRLVEYYGAAELSFVAADPDGGGLRPFPGAEVRVREGLVEVRSPYLSCGYVLPAGSVPGPWYLADDGFAGVGDHGRLDDVLEVLGRDATALSVGGTVVLAADVERVLGAVDGVLEAVCVGEHDERLGQRPAAVVRAEVPASGRADLVRRLRAAARAQLPAPARPVRYVVVRDLPRTPAGKTDAPAVAALVSGAR